MRPRFFDWRNDVVVSPVGICFSDHSALRPWLREQVVALLAEWIVGFGHDFILAPDAASGGTARLTGWHGCNDLLAAVRLHHVPLLELGMS